MTLFATMWLVSPCDISYLVNPADMDGDQGRSPHGRQSILNWQLADWSRIVTWSQTDPILINP
jgi:hypothetical protein